MGPATFLARWPQTGPVYGFSASSDGSRAGARLLLPGRTPCASYTTSTKGVSLQGPTVLSGYSRGAAVARLGFGAIEELYIDRGCNHKSCRAPDLTGSGTAGPSPRYDAADTWRLSLRLRPGQLRGRTAVRRRRAMMPACSHFVLRHSLPPPSSRPLRSPHWYGVLLVLHSSEMCLCPRRYSRPTRRRARGLLSRAGWPGRAQKANWT